MTHDSSCSIPTSTGHGLGTLRVANSLLFNDVLTQGLI